LYFVLERDGRIVEAGETALRLAPGPVVGKLFRELLLDFTAVEDLDGMLRRPGPHLLTLLTRDGVPQTFQFSFADLGRRIVCLGAQDSQDTEMLRKTLLETNQELAARTRELQRSNARLESINAQKNRFLGMAAHDLRTPISHVLYSADMLRDEAVRLSPQQAEALSIIDHAGHSMLRILDDLLDIANIEAGRFSLNLAPGDLAALIRTVVARLTPLAAAKDMRLSCQLPAALPELVYDAVRIEQLLTNLITNAVKYGPPGTTAQIAGTCRGGHVAISVADQGVGVALEDRERIFEPFGRGQARPTGDEKSIGLGLCIARTIARGHGGDLVVDRWPDHGAVFVCTLPHVQRPANSGDPFSAHACLH
jgi:signal transduction histidine kinase